MTVLLMTDLEGISGVNSIDQMEGEGYVYACRRLEADINAAVAGCFDGGATRVLVLDGHATGINFDPKNIDPRAELPGKAWQDEVKSGKVDLVMEVGIHAMPGTMNGFLDHTQSSVQWFEYTINGRKCGEVAQGALFAGEYGVPFVMVSGDVAACEEAREFLGNDIATAVVKRGIGRNKAECLPNDEAEKLIYEAAKKGMTLKDKVKPFKMIYPLEVKLVHTRTDYCDATMERHPEFDRIDARTARFTVDRIVNYGDIMFW